MFSSNGRISLRQGFRLYLFDFVGISSLVVLPYLAQNVGVGGVFSIVLGVAWGLIYLLFLYEIHGKMETDLGTFLQEFVPTGVRVAVQMWLTAHCVAVAGFAAYLFGTLIQYSLLDGESFPVILVVILVVAAYAISGGVESRARVYEVLFWLVLVPLVVMLVAAGTQMESVYFEEITDVGFLDMLHGSYLVFLFFATAFWTLFLTRYLAERDAWQSSAAEGNIQHRKHNDMSSATSAQRNRVRKQKLQQSEQNKAGNVRDREEGSSGALSQYDGFFKRVALAIVLAGALLVVAYLVCLGNFGGAALAEMDFPIITLMSSIRIPGNFVKRLDALMIAVWFFMLFAFLNLHLFYGVQMVRELLGEPMAERKKNRGCCFGVKNQRGKKVAQIAQSRVVHKKEDTEFAGQSSVEANGKEAFAERKIITSVVVMAGVLAFFYYYNAAAVDAFFGYIYYVGTPLLVVSPIIIYWFGRGRRT